MNKQLKNKLWLILLTSCICFNIYGISTGKLSMFISLAMCLIPLPYWLLKDNK